MNVRYLLVSLSILPSVVSAFPRYQLEIVNFNNGSPSERWLTGINNNGDVSGYEVFPDENVVRGYRRLNGELPEQLSNYGNTRYAYALAINGQGVVCGQASGDFITFQPRAARWDSPTSVAPLVRFNGVSVLNAYEGWAVNDSNTVVGIIHHDFTLGTGACYWLADGSGGLLAGSGIDDLASAEDINNAGRIVGGTTLFGATLWTSYDAPPIGLDRPDNSATIAYSINEQGYVAGISQVGPRRRLIVWNPQGHVHALVPLPVGFSSYKAIINDNGDVAVEGRTGSIQTLKIWLWNANTGLVDLKSLIDTPGDWYPSQLRGFNNRGQVVSDAYFGTAIPATLYHNVLLTPVPEPATFAALALGLVPLLRRRKR